MAIKWANLENRYAIIFSTPSCTPTTDNNERSFPTENNAPPQLSPPHILYYSCPSLGNIVVRIIYGFYALKWNQKLICFICISIFGMIFGDDPASPAFLWKWWGSIVPVVKGGGGLIIRIKMGTFRVVRKSVWGAVPPLPVTPRELNLLVVFCFYYNKGNCFRPFKAKNFMSEINRFITAPATCKTM